MIEKILIRVPKELKDMLKRIGKAKGITLNQLILQILWDWAESRQNAN